MKKVNDWLFAPEEGQDEILNNVFVGYDFGRIEKDLFGVSRTEKSKVGAINELEAAEKFKIDKATYGPEWFSSSQVR